MEAADDPRPGGSAEQQPQDDQQRQMQGIQAVAQPLRHFQAAAGAGENQGQRQPCQRLQMEKRREQVAQIGPAEEAQLVAEEGRDRLTAGAPEQGVAQKSRCQSAPGSPGQIQQEDEGQSPPAVVDFTEAQYQIAQGRAPELTSKTAQPDALNGGGRQRQQEKNVQGAASCG